MFFPFCILLTTRHHTFSQQFGILNNTTMRRESTTTIINHTHHRIHRDSRILLQWLMGDRRKEEDFVGTCTRTNDDETTECKISGANHFFWTALEAFVRCDVKCWRVAWYNFRWLSVVFSRDLAVCMSVCWLFDVKLLFWCRRRNGWSNERRFSCENIFKQRNHLVNDQISKARIEEIIRKEIRPTD